MDKEKTQAEKFKDFQDFQRDLTLEEVRKVRRCLIMIEKEVFNTQKYEKNEEKTA